MALISRLVDHLFRLLSEDDVVPKMRTAIVTISRMLRDIIFAVIGRLIEIDIVGEFESRDEIGLKLKAVGPGLVVIGLRPEEPDHIAGLLCAALPAALIIAASHDGRRAAIASAKIGRTVLTDLSSEALADAIAAILLRM